MNELQLFTEISEFCDRVGMQEAFRYLFIAMANYYDAPDEVELFLNDELGLSV